MAVFGRLRKYVTGKFNLHRTPHLVLTGTEHELRYFRQRELVMFKHVGEGDELATRTEFVVADHPVVHIECRDEVFQSTGLECVGHGHFHNIECVVGREFAVFLTCQRQCVEICLGVAQGKLKGRCLENLVGMRWRETQRLSTIHYI